MIPLLFALRRQVHPSGTNALPVCTDSHQGALRCSVQALRTLLAMMYLEHSKRAPAAPTAAS